MENKEIEDIFKDNHHLFEKFLERIKNDFLLTPKLSSSIHSIRYRIKDIEHLKEKIHRKESEGREINKENFYNEITDIAGVRVLHLNSNQFLVIHDFINKLINENEYILFEKPIAYTWDPEMVTFFQERDLETKLKPSYYTSVHYVVMPRAESIVKCEIQVRNLFEEIWGEIDHKLNYPKKCEIQTIIEQLKVLARLSSTGTKLVDSIMVSYNN